MMELWPFTNFHDLNLDWIIKTILDWVKKMQNFVSSMTEAWNQMEGDWSDYQSGLNDQWQDFIDNTYKDQIEEILERHPEWTTTVMDGAVGTAKLADRAVTQEKIATPLHSLLDTDYETYRYTNSSNYATTINYKTIPADHKPALKLANDTVNTVEEAGAISERARASVCINAGIFNTSTHESSGYVIADEVVYKDTANDTGVKGDILYMKADGTLQAMDQHDTFTALQARDPIWAVQGWYAFIKNGTYVYDNYWDTLEAKPYTWIAQNTAGDYLVATCSGRSLREEGMTVPEIVDWLTNDSGFNAEFAYLLDGGGSSSMLVGGVRVNKLVEGESRAIANCLTWTLDDYASDDVFEDAEVTNQELIDINKYLYENTEEQRFLSSGVDMNDLKKRGRYIVSENTTAATISNIPVSKAGTLHVSYAGGSTSYYTIQEYVTIENAVYRRRYNQGTNAWDSWYEVATTVILEHFDNLETGTIIAANTDLNDYHVPGVYYSPDGANTQTLSNCPLTTAFCMTVRTFNGTYQTDDRWNYLVRELYRLGHPEEIYKQQMQSNGSGVYTAGSWYKITGTAI